MSGIRSKESELALKGRKGIKRTRTLEIENKSENRLYMAIGAYPNSRVFLLVLLSNSTEFSLC